MDKLKNNNKEHAVIASIECSYTNAADADVDVESNKSTPTPYFTPLEYLQTSFEFPSPTTATAAAAEPARACDEETLYTPKQFTICNPKQQQQQQPTQQLPQSPTTLNRKFKRFSLYDRRSCSPQDGRIFANKENTIPKKCNTDNDHDSLYLSKSEHNSPTILFRDDSSTTTTTTTTTTPNLLNDSSRLSYSPKLLASINNLNLNHSLSGSPLNIINSAGYKNGNFFRFPEIDHVVQDMVPPATVALAAEEPDNQQQANAVAVAQLQQEAGRRNRKNKNNLTIRITDVQLAGKGSSAQPASPSTLAKPKTPTIKCTKEKARSLDSAANETELSIVVHHINESHDMSAPGSSSGHANASNMLMQPSASSLYSTSLSRLDTQQSLQCRRTTRRKSPGLNNSDWQMYHRKQNPYQSSLDTDELRSASSTDGNSGKFSLGANLAPRSAHKLNPMLHSSSTNLKTLPECLTLVEFTPIVGVESPFKQKSMDLPGSGHMQAKSMASSMNLLQRRGSNHSLTLNLHSSCGNLMNSGLSVSNYSLGSVSNSKSSCNLEQQQQQQQLQPPSQQHQQHQQQQPHNQLTVAAGSAQCTRQGLFRRRGSNHSITLKTNNTTNSCGELNSMANQTPSHVATTPKRGLLERRGSNQSLTLNMSGQLIGGVAVAADQLQPKLTVCSCGAANAAQSPHQRKFFSTENLNSNRGGNSSQYLDFSSKQPLCFGSASDLQPSEQSKNKSPAAHAEPGVVLCSCAAGGGGGGVGVGVGIRNIMTRPLSPQTTSEEFKIYLASIQMLQSASNPLNQYDLIKLNHVFDDSYKVNLEQPPVLVLGRGEGGTPTNQVPPTSEDSELLAMYQAVVKRIVTPLPQLSDDEQKRIFRDLHKEFWDLPLNHQEKPMVFGSQTKNRYKTILPNEHSRVLLESEATELLNLQQQHQQSCLLQPQTSSEELISKTTLLANEDLPYINANYIKGPDYVSKCYVASQGPLPNTIFEFWLMIYQNTQRYIRRCMDGGGSSSPHVDRTHILQQYYQKIVMLTNFTECNRQKCAIYFPIELNEIFAVAAKGEVFELSALARDYFEPHLLPTLDSVECGVTSSELQQPATERELNNRWHIAIDSVKVTLSESLRRTLPADGSFFLAKNVGIVRRNGYSVRKLIVLYCINVPESSGRLEYYLQKICCYHYWYPDWPDHHSPRDINTLLDTCLHVLNLGKCESEFDNYDDKRYTRNAHLSAQRLEIYKQDIFNAVQPLPVIHCSAGIGRTGCFTAILNAVRQLRQSLAYSLTGMLSRTLTMADVEAIQNVRDADTESSFSCNTILHIQHIVEQPDAVSFDQLPKMPDIFVDILGIVCNLRLQRGGMVQNSEQYELIHRAICLYLKRTLALRRF
ncbi:uncharacterized protein PTP-ER [Drosophila virilis]|uniref:Uncharacterized protein n=1 Tax=Drosophila virilis TaxID=7244 RepID=B4LMP1_DROVI|nr:uncharacterized protein LOC6625597 [Drosophila virilis]EDW60028.1 uncharacterized protein Dvir_GJ21098 [Drosophila virilis]